MRPLFVKHLLFAVALSAIFVSLALAQVSTTTDTQASGIGAVEKRDTPQAGDQSIRTEGETTQPLQQSVIAPATPGADAPGARCACGAGGGDTVGDRRGAEA